MDEVTPVEEHLPHSVRLTLLQTSVRSIPELRIVETMEEYMSLTQTYSGQYSLTYDNYFMMLQNACIRYDKTLKHKPSPTSRAIYQHDIAGDDPLIQEKEEDYPDVDHDPDVIDTAFEDMYNIQNINLKRPPHVKSLIPRKPNPKFKPSHSKPKYDGPVYLPKHIYLMLNEGVKKALDK